MGLTQAWGQSMRVRCEQLKHQGVGTTLPDQWRDKVWQRPPRQAIITVSLREKDAIHIDQQRFTKESGRERVVQLQQALADVGVAETLIRMI